MLSRAADYPKVELALITQKKDKINDTVLLVAAADALSAYSRAEDELVSLIVLSAGLFPLLFKKI